MRELSWKEILNLIRGRAIRAIDIPAEGMGYRVGYRTYFFQFFEDGVLHVWEGP